MSMSVPHIAPDATAPLLNDCAASKESRMCRASWRTGMARARGAAASAALGIPANSASSGSLHQYPTTHLINKRRTDGPVVEDSR
jgi:hypothetical protein